MGSNQYNRFVFAINSSSHDFFFLFGLKQAGFVDKKSPLILTGKEKNSCF